MAKVRERWKPIKHVAKFEVSNFGRIRYSGSMTPKTPTLAESGYLVVNLYADGLSNVRNVHSVVAEAFLGPPPDRYNVVHLDQNRLNNRADNLAYWPRGEALRLSRQSKVLEGQAFAKDQISEDQAREIRDRARAGESTKSLAREFGISSPYVSNIKNGRKWRNLDSGGVDGF